MVFEPSSVQDSIYEWRRQRSLEVSVIRPGMWDRVAVRWHSLSPRNTRKSLAARTASDDGINFGGLLIYRGSWLWAWNHFSDIRAVELVPFWMRGGYALDVRTPLQNSSESDPMLAQHWSTERWPRMSQFAYNRKGTILFHEILYPFLSLRGFYEDVNAPGFSFFDLPIIYTFTRKVSPIKISAHKGPSQWD